MPVSTRIGPGEPAAANNRPSAPGGLGAKTTAFGFALASSRATRVWASGQTAATTMFPVREASGAAAGSTPGGAAEPLLDLGVEASVRAEMMAVRREMQPFGIGRQAAAEQRLEAQRAVLKDHSSGKMRFSSVERRYGAPADPPVPGLLPIIRSTVSTCLWRQLASASSMSTSFSASS